jgi:CRP/FNR family cyclic AMP-dependent transcriptional regulator
MQVLRRKFDVIEHFRQAAKVLALPAGVEIFKAGDPGDVMYVVMAGYANVFVGTTIVEIAAPGSLLGEMALIDQQPRSATVVTRTASQLLPIGISEFDLLVQETPAFSRYVLTIVTERLRRMNENLGATRGLDGVNVRVTANTSRAMEESSYSYAPQHVARPT